MDSNLQFRFSIPGWTFALTVITMLWARGVIEPANLMDLANNGNAALGAAVLTCTAVLLSGPTVGFLLNTIVVLVADLLNKGPLYSEAFDCLAKLLKQQAAECADLATAVYGRARAREIIDDVAQTENTKDWWRWRRGRKHTAAPLVAFFEYRLDPKELLEWRRRQRAAFYSNWANAVAILLGLMAGSLWSWQVAARPWWCEIAELLVAALFLLMLGSNAKRSMDLADQEQMLWVKSWKREDALAFLDHYGTGYPTYVRDASTGQQSGQGERRRKAGSWR